MNYKVRYRVDGEDKTEIVCGVCDFFSASLQVKSEWESKGFEVIIKGGGEAVSYDNYLLSGDKIDRLIFELKNMLTYSSYPIDLSKVDEIFVRCLSDVPTDVCFIDFPLIHTMIKDMYEVLNERGFNGCLKPSVMDLIDESIRNYIKPPTYEDV